MAENPDALKRVAQGVIQGVMAGISFIGTGVILRNVETRIVEGLTTAATVWVAAALGVACGLGALRTIAIAIPVTLACCSPPAGSTDSRSGTATMMGNSPVSAALTRQASVFSKHGGR
jgi:uncharacterized membrane protein YhiD involved in acid resistance